MSGRFAGWLTTLLSAPLLILAASADALTRDDEALGFEQTPPRLSYTDGSVSFSRAGAADWAPAQVNTPLAAGDLLLAGDASNFELQIGPRAFARGGEQAELGLTSLEPDYLQLRVTSGTVALDLRSLTPGQTLEVDTPNAAFKIEHAGYYRLAIAQEETSFTCRRGGQASATVATGETLPIAANEQLIVRGTLAPEVETVAAAELDPWDRWNYSRSETRNEAVSARYVPSDVYGTEDLDRYGDWSNDPTYGSVWAPRGVASGWVPYSTGYWLSDPYYGWSWVDYAPWGWAPYHYGRWVHLNGFWGWCPGPRVARAYYAPALVGFYGSPTGVVSYGAPSLGWVALGWGEPLLPWWGPTYFRSSPWWGGWGGPHHHHGSNWDHHDHDGHGHGRGGHGGHGGHHGGWDGHDGGHGGWDGGGDHRDRGDGRDWNGGQGLQAYENARVKGAIVSVDRDQFGRRSRTEFRRASSDELQPLQVGASLPERQQRQADSRPGRGADRPVVTARRERASGDRVAPPAAFAEPRPGDLRPGSPRGTARDGARNIPRAGSARPGRDNVARNDGRRGRAADARPAPPPADSLRRNPPRFAGDERVATVPREQRRNDEATQRRDARDRQRVAPQPPQQMQRRERERADRQTRVERQTGVDPPSVPHVERMPAPRAARPSAPRVEAPRAPRVEAPRTPRIEREAPPQSVHSQRPQAPQRGADAGGRGSGRGDGSGRGSGRSDGGGNAWGRGDGGGGGGDRFGRR